MNSYSSTNTTYFNHNRLNIGAYYLQPYARSEQHIKDVADCGIDFILNFDYDRDALELFAKYGIGAVVTGIVPSWFGGDGGNAGQMETTNPLEAYEEGAKNYNDHPAIWGIDAGDEPSCLDFPHYGRVIDKINKLFPKQFAYMNLYPNYAMVAGNSASSVSGQLGVESYAEYIKRYCEYVPADYICFDFYLYEHYVTMYYENLRIVADAARNTGRNMWIVLQVNSAKPDVWMSENNLRFQAYSSMAFGAQTIIWACYTDGWWVNQVLDAQGNKTQQYDKLKKINAEIKAIGEEYIHYRRVSTHFVGFTGNPDMEYVNQEPIESLNTGVFFDVKADNGAPILVGQMVSREGDGSYALMVCGADDHHEQDAKSYNIVFRAEDRAIAAVGGNGRLPVTKLENGYFSVPITSNEGIFITAR